MADPVAERLAAIRARIKRASPPPWDADPHTHLESGCRCMSCEDVVGWLVDHPKALHCDDLVAKRSGAGEKNNFGRDLDSCEFGPLLSYHDAEFAAHARADVPDLLDAVQAVLNLADRLDGDAASLRRRGAPADAPTAFTVERGDRCADLNHAAEDIRQAVANALGTDTKETAGDRSA